MLRVCAVWLARVLCSMFSIEADLLTPTFKLKRPQLQKLYQKEVGTGLIIHGAHMGSADVTMYAFLSLCTHHSALPQTSRCGL